MRFERSRVLHFLVNRKDSIASSQPAHRSSSEEDILFSLKELALVFQLDGSAGDNDAMQNDHRRRFEDS